MAYGFFLGCVAPHRYPGIESSTREVMKALGVDIVDLEGASCCPAPGVTRSFDQQTWLALAARNLVIAERKGVDIITICNGCYGSLFDVAHELNHDADKRKKVNKILKEVGMEYSGSVNVYHFAEVFSREVGIEKIREKITRNLEGMKVAVHYGCHFLKPTSVKGLGDAERPRMLDELVEATGAESIDYPDKQMCCGAGGGVRARAPEIAQAMTTHKLKMIHQAGGEFIVDVCPFCHLQYDKGQGEVEHKIPVLHLSQLYGLAMGLDKSRLGIEAHEIKAEL